MNVLIIGSGGREHALAWKLAQSARLRHLYAAPGNPGIARHGQCVAIPAEDVEAIVRFSRERRIDLAVIGPEAPLAAGLSDHLAEAGIAVFGPSRAAARLEASKAFTKAVCEAAGAPTARYGAFTDPAAAIAFLDTLDPPYVLKADGLAAGKGVVIAQTRAEAEAEIAAMLSGKFGAASETLVIEEFLKGEEASLFVLCDGERAVPLAGAQDHKRAFDGDEGPNTGGMGAYSPAPVLTQAVRDRAMAEIIAPCLKVMAERGTPYRGVLYAGLMIEAGLPRLIEFNVRFGDPECQVLMVRLKSDLLACLHACADPAGTGGLAALPSLDWSPHPAVTVVMAAKGYPGAYEKGSVIGGVEAAEAVEGVSVFQAGTAAGEGGALIAAGGRVLNVTATGADLAAAVRQAYAGVDAIDWPQGFCRRDIAARALGPR